jgi:multiple sugar transport system substrate-binding protein
MTPWLLNRLSTHCRVLVITAVIGLLTSCGGPRSPALVLAVGGAPAELAFWESLAAEFAAQHRIRVELMRQPSDTALRRQSLVIALSAGQPHPDVFLMDVAWLVLIAASGWLEPLEGKVDPGPFFPGIIERADTYQGRLAALPVTVDAGVLYYRKDLLQSQGVHTPPQTWEALSSLAVSVQRRQRPDHPDFFGFVWQGAQYEGLICNFMEFAGSNGGFIEQGSRIGVNMPQNAAALRFMRGLIWESRVSPPSTYTEMKEEQTRTFFQNGNALFERNWPYAWALHQQAGSPVRGKVGISPLPAPAGSGPVAALGGWHIGISRFSDRKADALELVRFLTARNTQQRMALELGWNPGRRDLYGDAALAERASHLKVLAQVFEHARPRPGAPYYNQLSDTAQRYISAVLARRLEAEDALGRAQEEIDTLAARYSGRPPRRR